MAWSILPFLVLAVLAPTWYAAGRLAQSLRLPLITGVMLAGVASGPQALGLLNAESLSALKMVDHGCLSLIALAAGAELQLTELRKLRRQVFALTLTVSCCSWAAVFAAFQLLRPQLPFIARLSGRVPAAAASLAATIAVARSPASAIAVVRELGGKGPYCSLVMAVVLVKDIFVFVAFSINIELARLASLAADTELSWRQLAEPLLGVVAAALLGAASGYMLMAGLHPSGPAPHRHHHILHHSSFHHDGLAGAGGDGWLSGFDVALPAPRAMLGRLRSAAPMAVSAATFIVAESVGAEPLLACVTAGLVVSNSRRLSFAAAGQEPAAVLAADLSFLMPAVNAVFFGLVGASLRLAAMRSAAWVALLLWLARLAGIWLGCVSGAAAAGGVDPEVRQRLWMGMVTQAGIALGLAQVVVRRFPAWGPDLAALVAGVVLLNLTVGPPLFRAAVVGAGEARSLDEGTVFTPDGKDAAEDCKPGDRSEKLHVIPIIDTNLMSTGSLRGVEW